MLYVIRRLSTAVLLRSHSLDSSEMSRCPSGLGIVGIGPYPDPGAEDCQLWSMMGSASAQEVAHAFGTPTPRIQNARRSVEPVCAISRGHFYETTYLDVLSIYLAGKQNLRNSRRSKYP